MNMQPQSESSSVLTSPFSHIYIENSAQNSSITQQVLEHFPSAIRIPISSYTELFHRPRQDWRSQKSAMKLILAHKKDGFLYSGSAVTPHFGHQHYFYNTLIMNCVYDCDYCYLQGLYSSGNVVIFVNLEDYFAKTLETLKTCSPLYLCISYDTDLLAFEPIVPYCTRWIEFVRENQGITIEIRTKCANVKPFLHISPCDQVILAWTLSPQQIITRHESRTPSLEARFRAIQKMIALGWKVRICIDPVLKVSNWEQHYSELIERIENEIPHEKIVDVSVGLFRMNKTFLHRIQKQRQDSSILFEPFQTYGKTVSYSDIDCETISSQMEQKLYRFLPSDRVWVNKTPENVSPA